MDQVIRKNIEMEAFGRQDLSVFLEEKVEEKPLYLFETDKILEDEEASFREKLCLKGVANGY